MATYKTKYHTSFTYPDGSVIGLTIKQKGWTGGTYEIANLQALRLQIGGGSEPVYKPVVKTTLVFSMADEFDVGTTVGGLQCVTNENGVYTKHGRWEEFYTNDATKYLVQLSWESEDLDAPVRSNTIIWQGYITPDSWSESMLYHGSITITARDMLGALSDVDFDYEGVNGYIQVGDMVARALDKCSAAMTATFPAAMNLRNITEDTSILNARIPVKLFKGRTWWNALEDTLEALGMVMRYDGNGGWVVAALRYLPEISQENQYVEFVNRSGLRTLDPPVKEIAAEYEAEIEPQAIVPLASADLSLFGNVSVAEIYPLSSRQMNVSAYELGSASGDWAAAAGTQDRPPLFIQPLQVADYYAGSLAVSKNPYFICNTGKLLAVGMQRNYGVAKVKAGTFKAPCKLIIEQDGELVTIHSGRFYRPTANYDSDLPALKSVSVYISADGKYYRGPGNWVTGDEKNSDQDSTSGRLDPVTLNFENGVASMDIYPPATSTGQYSVTVNIVHVETSGHDGSGSWAIFAPLKVSVGEPDESGLANLYGTKTIYNENYNVRISRTPTIGSVDTPLPGKIFKNVLLDAAGAPFPNSWNWAGQNSGYPLEVMVQAQLLQLYSDALSIFTGTIHNKSFAEAIPGSTLIYYNRACVLLRGTFDFRTRFIADAAIREYRTWEEVWGNNFNPEYTVKEEREGDSAGSGHSSGGSSGGGGGGGTVVEWGETAGTGYQQLKVGGDTTHTVALQGHKHVIADITDLAALIPNQASANNQLADKNYVNSSVATSTATFRGTSQGGLTEAEFLEWADSLTHDLNDYCFWLTSDAAGNTLFKRYKYDWTQWLFEYALNNSSFTAAQWAAINSGITASLVTKLAFPDTELNAQSSGKTTLVTAGAIWAKIVELVTAIAAKATAAWGAITNHKAPLTVNDVSRTVLLDGWNPGTAGNKGLPVFAAPRTETDTYYYVRGTGDLSPQSVSVNEGQPRPVNHIGTHPELSNPVVVPGMVNDLAGFLTRGGKCAIYVNGTERTDALYDYAKGNLFDIGPASLQFQGTSGAGYNQALSNSDDTVKISLDLTPIVDARRVAEVVSQVTRYTTKWQWGSTFFVDFCNNWWGPEEVLVTVRYGYFTISGSTISSQEMYSYRERYKFVGQTVSSVRQHLDFAAMNLNSQSGYGIIGIDVEFTGFNRDSGDNYYKPRVAEIGLYNLGSAGLAEALMSRFRDDAIFRSITPANSEAYDLGTAGARWRYLHAKRVYLSSTAYLEVDSYGKAHLYGATGLVVENGDIASAGAPQS